MTFASPTMSAFPQKLSSIVVSVGGLALFLIFASWLLISHPIGSTVSGYFYNVDHATKSGSSIPWSNQTTIEPHHEANVDVINKNPPSETDLEVPVTSSGPPFQLETKESANQQTPVPTLSSDSVKEEGNTSFNASGVKAGGESVNTHSPNNAGNAQKGSDGSSQDDSPSSSKSENVPSSSLLPQNSSNIDSGCDLYNGNWYYDSSGPLYTNNTCPVLTQMQNCQGNGRPDKEYENYRWKPSQCDLPRFDAKKFLELMRGKTLAFIGDSVARNQMESMMCILWQVEVPKNRGNRNMQRWFFKSTSVMIVRIWSSWLVQTTSEPFDFAPEGVTKVHLDVPDEKFMEYIQSFDVMVLSSGHWFAKPSAYILNKEIVGGQLWWPDKSRSLKINNIEAFGVSTEKLLTSIATHPNYTGLTIVRSFSPDHYEGGAWNTGGSCTGKVKPIADGKLVENGFTDIMHEKQVMGFNRAIKKQTNKSKLRLMDITKAFGYRHDGHPGPYRSPDPNKITKRGRDGRPPPQDCLHWCMPGPIDTWNELVLEIIRREYEGNENLTL